MNERLVVDLTRDEFVEAQVKPEAEEEPEDDVITASGLALA
jgi:hypothetical protein